MSNTKISLDITSSFDFKGEDAGLAQDYMASSLIISGCNDLDKIKQVESMILNSPKGQKFRVTFEKV